MTPQELLALRSHLVGPGRIGPLLSLTLTFLRVVAARWSGMAPGGTELLLHRKKWIRESAKMYGLAGQKRPNLFVRRRCRLGVSVFAAEGARETKTALLCFSGNAQRMMMPLPVFLQHIDPASADVILLRTERRKGYRNGIPGVTGDLGTSVSALNTLLALKEYRRISIMGTSGGGLPALLAGLQLGADVVLSVGGNSPDDERWRNARSGDGATCVFQRFMRPGVPAPRIFLVHGSKSKRDTAAVSAIADRLKNTGTFTIAGAGHNVLWPLVKRRRFRHLLQETVFSDFGLSDTHRESADSDA